MGRLAGTRCLTCQEIEASVNQPPIPAPFNIFASGHAITHSTTITHTRESLKKILMLGIGKKHKTTASWDDLGG
jgi:hypothetical protein